jgi:murein tripeptide amidase MpaA
MSDANLNFDWTKFYRYAELTGLLHQCVKAYPNLLTLHSMGKSFEGRDLWVLEVTNAATGPISEKPAFWIDGNIHSIEVTASAAVLYFLEYLLKGYGADAEVTRALDTRGFYLCPRINPDGAEWALADIPRYVRSSTRTYPRTYPEIEAVQEGFEVQDVDSDGKILRMRVVDQHGHWKCHPDDSRVMVRREPSESGGIYYHIIPEGRFADAKQFDGTRIRVNPPVQGLDLNRNFPENWRPEADQLGAGDYPGSEPEVRAVVDWFTSHPNISGGVAFHTFSGVLLRPFGGKADTEMAVEDLRVYKRIGQQGTATTGYPNISVYEEFRYHPKEVITGTFDWAYDQLGIYSWVVEIWSPMREAGIEKYDYIDWFREHPIEDDLKLMRWNDSALAGKGFVDWRKFNHPQLGEVEIGGWDSFACISNVPKEKLASELAKFPKWLLWQALISPRLELRSASATSVGEGLYKVRLEVVNSGWLGTQLSQRAANRKAVAQVTAEVHLPEHVEILATTASGNQATHGALPRVRLGQLTGWSQKGASGWFWPDADITGHIGVAEWIVRGVAGSSVELTAHHPKAGKVSATVVL